LDQFVSSHQNETECRGTPAADIALAVGGFITDKRKWNVSEIKLSQLHLLRDTSTWISLDPNPDRRVKKPMIKHLT
jgi:hypothetical protein